MILDGTLEKTYDYFRVGGYPVVPAMCVGNPFHRETYDHGVQQGRLITFRGQLPTTFRALDISKIKMQGRSMLDLLTTFYAMELRSNEFPLVAGAERKFPAALVDAYLLTSTLCYVETEDKNGVSGFFATKSPAIYEAMSDYRTVAQRKQKPNSFYAQLDLAYAELNSNVFDALKFSADRDGYKVTKCRLNLTKPNVTILPMYSIAAYIDSIIAGLMKHRVWVTYLDGNVESKVLTSLRSDALAYWLRTCDPRAVQQAQGAWQNPFLFGEITLPDLKSSYQHVTLRVFNIQDIQVLD